MPSGPGTRFLRALALVCALLPGAAPAQPWPAKPVRIVVAYPAGGGIDVMARQLAERLGRVWGQPVVVENKPGANTIVAADAVAKSAPDGYTVLMTTDATFSINPHLYASLPFDTQRDFAPVTMLVLLQQLLVAHPATPFNDLKGLIAAAKAKPGSINYASYGSGSQPHLAGEMLKHAAGIDLVHVPYKGISLAVPAVIAGEVQLTFAGIATSSGPLKAGRIKALAIGGAQRSPLFPQVPTFAELGYPEVETHAWFGLFLPAGAPREAIARLYQDSSKLLQDPEFRQKQLIDRGYEVVGSSPEAFAAYIRKDSASRARAVKISGAKAE
ncbi:MAG TPA: tripartite tricarboxylate transporter substrate binding protein [Burkholderiales bacterium]|jgi:tripartite-type tricarboxylate transporter receptor subunit TctC|nr:tripartite tricarboxylate transporter substrate binding protein [Burkholderiales bacterium]